MKNYPTNKTIWLILILSLFVLIMTIKGTVDTVYAIKQSFTKPPQGIVIQRGEPEQYHRFNYDKTYLPGMEDTLVWEGRHTEP